MNAATSVTLYALSTILKMLASELSATTNTMPVKQTSAVRMVHRNVSSLMPGLSPLRMFSLNATDGASKVALEQLMMAESTAPKKTICAAAIPSRPAK